MSTFLEMMKKHPEVKTWCLELYSIETPKYTQNGQYTYCNQFFVDDSYRFYAPKNGTPQFLHYDDEYSFYGDANSDLDDYQKYYGDADSDDYGMLDAIECTEMSFDETYDGNGDPCWTLVVMRDDIEHYIIDDKDVHSINKVTNYNGNTYLWLLSYGNVSLFVDEHGDEYIVAFDTEYNDIEECVRWRQGMYFTDEFNALSDALEYYYNKITPKE